MDSRPKVNVAMSVTWGYILVSCLLVRREHKGGGPALSRDSDYRRGDDKGPDNTLGLIANYSERRLTHTRS